MRPRAGPHGSRRRARARLLTMSVSARKMASSRGASLQRCISRDGPRVRLEVKVPAYRANAVAVAEERQFSTVEPLSTMSEPVAHVVAQMPRGKRVGLLLLF